MNFDILRKKILEKAIRGELVPQLESEPVVAQIGEVPEDVPFLVPEKWKWCNFGDLVAYGKCEQVQPQNIEEDAWILDLEDIESGTGNLLQKKKGISVQSNKSRFKKGDILYSKLRPYLNKVIVADDDGYCTTEIVPISLSVAQAPLDAQYLKIYLMSPYFVGYANQCSYGVKMPRLGTKDAKKALFPIPPIEEQHRIVEKIKKLFEQIDSAEKAYNELSGPLSERFRQLCLEKAIQGKLVPQLESELEVEQIGNAPEEVPFEIPKKWKWVQLSSAGKIVGGGTPKTGITAYWGGKISWITPADLGRTGGRYISFGAKSITQTGLDNSSAKLLPPGSVVYSSRAPIGHIAIAGKELCTNQGCKSFIPNFKTITTEWGYFCLIARTPDIISRASGTTFKEISGSGVGETWIPLPPLAEQRRIVDKLKTCLKQIEKLQQE